MGRAAIEEGIADIKAGRYVDYEIVDKWLEKLANGEFDGSAAALDKQVLNHVSWTARALLDLVAEHTRYVANFNPRAPTLSRAFRAILDNSIPITWFPRWQRSKAASRHAPKFCRLLL